MPWTNEQLFAALDRYEHQCVAAGLKAISVHSYVNYARMFLRWRVGEYRPRGSTIKELRPSGAATAEGLHGDLGDYEVELSSAGLQPRAIHTYVTHAAQFVRWLDGRFSPGGTLAHQPDGSVSRGPTPRRESVPRPNDGPDDATDDGVEPWVHGAFELIQEGSERLKRGSDADKRRALVLFDEAIEQSIKIFGSIPRTLRDGPDLPAERRSQTQGRLYNEKIDFLEWYLSQQGKAIRTPLARIRWYHILRNEIYHAGNGMVPELKNVIGLQNAAIEVFEALFGSAAGAAARRSTGEPPAPSGITQVNPEPTANDEVDAGLVAGQLRYAPRDATFGPWRVLRTRRNGERFLTKDADRPPASQVRFHYGGPCQHGDRVPQRERVPFIRVGGPDDGKNGVMHAVPACWRSINPPD